jgi:hypothetical protein
MPGSELCRFRSENRRRSEVQPRRSGSASSLRLGSGGRRLGRIKPAEQVVSTELIGIEARRLVLALAIRGAGGSRRATNDGT